MHRSVNINIVQEEECTEEMALLSGVTGGEEVGEVETSLSNLNLGQNINMVLKLRYFDLVTLAFFIKILLFVLCSITPDSISTSVPNF